jgi:hypothetical protein
VTEPEAVRRLLGALGLAARPAAGRPVTASGRIVDRGIEAVLLEEAGRVTSPSSERSARPTLPSASPIVKGVTPPTHARRRGYVEMAGILERTALRMGVAGRRGSMILFARGPCIC